MLIQLQQQRNYKKTKPILHVTYQFLHMQIYRPSKFHIIRLLSFGKQRHILWQKLANITEEPAVFKLQNTIPPWRWWQHAALKQQICSKKHGLTSQKPTIFSHRYKNLKSCMAEVWIVTYNKSSISAFGALLYEFPGLLLCSQKYSWHASEIAVTQ